MLLRSIAYQMALLSPVVRQRLLDMRNEGTTFDKDNEKLIWRKVFLLRCRFDQPQYWVIDALDECYNYNSLLPMLIKLESSIALRVLITSRQSPQLKDKLSLLDRYLYEDQISAEDTLPSIRRYVEHGPKSHALRRQSDEARQDVVEKILKKSDGCFLWVDLVLSELDAYGVTTEAVTRILEEVPPGMDDLYSRTLERLSEQDHPDGKRISKAILDWVVCAVRPLTVAELTNALKLDLDVTMFEQGIRSSCGNLVDIDKSKRGSTVQLVHQTARDFLLKADHPPEMTITAADAHRRIARTCLLFLRSSRIRPVRTKGASADNSSRISRTIDQSPFAPYAFTFFSAHVRRSPSDDDSLIDEIYHFLSTNGLSWIEHVAHTGRLDALVQASQDLNGYLQARAKHKPSLDQKSQHIQKWSVDLVRLVAKFGKHLVRCPSAIYGLIPPLAPGDSAIASYRDSRGIYVVGLSNNIWDVRLCGISYHGKAATAIACGDFSFAVGLQNGAVYLYDHQTFQELHIFQHEEAVKVLKYNSSGDLMDRDFVICGMDDGTIALYDTIKGRRLRDLYHHDSRHWISDIAWNSTCNLVASVDGSNTFFVKHLFQHGDLWEADEHILNERIDCPIKQILFSDGGLNLLVVTTENILAYHLPTKKMVVSADMRSSKRWINHPCDPTRLIAIDSMSLQIHDWSSLEITASWESNERPEVPMVQEVMSTADKKLLILKLVDGCIKSVDLSLVDDESPRSEDGEGFTLNKCKTITSSSEHVIGCLGSRLVFLTKDLWVCSTATVGSYSLTRHMFIPDEWINTSSRLLLRLNTKEDLVMVRRDEIAVIKRGLSHRAAVRERIGRVQSITF